MRRLKYILFVILSFAFGNLFGQCDYYYSVTVSTSGYHTGVGYAQQYVFVDDLTGIIMEINTSGTFTPTHSGLYRIYAVNYPSPAPASLSVGSLWQGVENFAAANCMDILGPYTGAAVSICEEQCELDDIIVSTSAYHTGGAYQQTYVLVNSLGIILETNTTGVFSDYDSGLYFVYAVNTEESAVLNEMNNLGAWADVQSMTSGYCMDIIGPLAIELTPAILPVFDPVADICEGATLSALPTSSNNTPAITGSWSPALDNTQTTTYTFTPDPGQCADTADITITVYTASTAIISNSTGTNELTCTTTEISVTAEGGDSYSWSGGTSTATATNSFTSAGTYTVTVSSSGCTATADITITENIVPPVPTITNNTGTDDLDCLVNEIVLTASGGVSYQWSGGSDINNATNTFTAAGTYFVTVTGANACTAATDYTITQSTSIDLSESTIDAMCAGLFGSATITVIGGGQPPYSIIWQDGNTDFTNNNIPANTDFYYTVTDAGLCPITGYVSLGELEDLSVEAVAYDALCYGTNSGSAEVTDIIGGTSPHNLLWSNGQIGTTATNLAPGTHNVTVTDFYSCTASTTVTVGSSSEISAAIISTNAICGGAGGILEVSNVSGGNGPYTYTWSVPGIGNTITNLAPGNYQVTIYDSNMCSFELSSTIIAEGTINAVVNIVTPISCSGSPDGVLQAVSSNGVAPLLFDWSNGATSSVNSNLGEGTYYVTVTDSWSCQGTAFNSLVQPDAVVLNVVQQSISCNGYNNGSLLVTMSNGIPPYDIEWNTGDTIATLTGLSAGVYTISVTDSNDCMVSQSYNITEPAAMSIFSTVRDVTCYGYNDGAILFGANGGASPYQYSISSGVVSATGAAHSALPAGIYTLVVSDNNNCTLSDEVMILEPAEIVANVAISSPSCIGHNDGYIEFYVVGGTEPYLYGWNGNISDFPIATNLLEGEYELSVIDARECEKILNSVILVDNPVECIRIPNAFTPNADGINDTWIIDNIDLFPGAYIFVFNRWGQEIYFGRPGDDPWDGKYGDKFVPAGAYLFIINLFDGSKPFSGTVTVVY